MAHLIRPFINAGGSPSAQEMYRSTRHYFDFTPDAFSPLKCLFFFLKSKIKTYMVSQICIMKKNDW